MMFKIGVNGAVLSAQRHGISRYTTQLLRHLSRIDTGEIEICVFASEEYDFDNVYNISNKTSGIFDRALWDTVGFPRRANSVGLDAIHSPDKGPFINVDMPLISTIHDLLPYLYPNERKFLNGKYWQLSLKRQAALSDAIITVSENTKRDLVDFFNIPPERVYVTPLGTNFSPPSKKKINETYNRYNIQSSNFNILYVGNYNERKNVDRIVSACKLASEEINDLNLLLSGSNPPESNLLKTAGEFKKSITFLGYVPDDLLESIYGIADLFVYPSSYEGFGLPVIEAMACGTPVITSNTSSLPEVAGSAAITIDPEQTSNISDAIKRVYSDAQLRTEMRTAGLKRAEEMTWERTARTTLNVYKQLASDN